MIVYNTTAHMIRVVRKLKGGGHGEGVEYEFQIPVGGSVDLYQLGLETSPVEELPLAPILKLRPRSVTVGNGDGNDAG